jgi:hypothetical protein
MAKTLSAAQVSAKQEADWRAEDDLRTLLRAAEIKKDPKRLAAAKAKAKEQMQALQAAQAAK